MKRSAFFVSIVLTLFFKSNLLAQSNNSETIVRPTDIPHGYTYDFDKAQQIILERQVQPDLTNIDVKPIIDSKDFPKIQAKTEITDQYIEKLKNWMEKNPTIIIENLKKRNDIVQPY